MNKLIASTIAAATIVLGTAFADTLELADGTSLEGKFVGSSNGIVMFETGGSIEAYPETEVEGISLSSGAAATQKAVEPKVQQEVQTSTKPTNVTIPSGTRLVIRMSDSIDSRQHGAGHKFRGQLEGAIAVDGMNIVPSGTSLHGQIVQAKSGGRAFGSSEMAIEFTDIMIDDQLFEIATTDLQAKTANETGKTARRTLRAAAIGGLVDGSDGAKTGAKVGAGVSILTRGSSINIPAGTILETTLRVPLNLPR
jgi:hypothetical protein